MLLVCLSIFSVSHRRSVFFPSYICLFLIFASYFVHFSIRPVLTKDAQFFAAKQSTQRPCMFIIITTRVCLCIDCKTFWARKPHSHSNGAEKKRWNWTAHEIREGKERKRARGRDIVDDTERGRARERNKQTNSNVHSLEVGWMANTTSFAAVCMCACVSVRYLRTVWIFVLHRPTQRCTTRESTKLPGVRWLKYLYSLETIGGKRKEWKIMDLYGSCVRSFVRTQSIEEEKRGTA